MLSQRIDDLLIDMKELITRYTPIGKEKYVVKIDNSNEAIAYQFILDFRNEEYQKLYEIFRLPLDSHQSDKEGYVLWDRYFIGDKNHLAEVKLLKKQARVCRNKWSLFLKLIGMNYEKEETEDEVEGNENNDIEDAERIGN